jgi:YesN/AraC family two-component response regulator
MRKNKILFVDDEINIINSIRRVVTEAPFESFFAVGAAEAMAIMKEHRIGVLVTDMRMPDMDGLSLLKFSNQEYPETVRVVLSGYTDASQLLGAINQGEIFRYITKPWGQPEELMKVLEQALSYYNLRQEKRELELSLQQKNAAYVNMLMTMDELFSRKKEDVIQTKALLTSVFSYLEGETGTASRNLSLHLRIIKELSQNYLDTQPGMLEDFFLEDVHTRLEKQLAEHNAGMHYSLELTVEQVKCRGNLKLLVMILLTISKLVHDSGLDRVFKCITSAEKNKNLIRVSHVIEIGYVDGAKVLIDANGVLSYDNLDYYTGLLAQIGKPFGIFVNYSYINQNLSVISVTSQFDCVKP